MIRMEYPRAELERYPDSEKVFALKKQVDMLTYNLQIVLDSIEDDMQNLVITDTSSGGDEPTPVPYTETDPTVPAWAKQPTKPTYTAVEVGALPSGTTIPTKTSDLTNDSGFITGYTETDPTVPAWAKASNKPTYTASEVGALPSTTSIPSKTSDLTNDSNFITLNQVPKELPTVTSSDNGKVLRVVSGAWSAVLLPSASGVSF